MGVNPYPHLRLSGGKYLDVCLREVLNTDTWLGKGLVQDGVQMEASERTKWMSSKGNLRKTTVLYQSN